VSAPADSAVPVRQRAGWTDVAERGSVLAIRTTVLVTTFAGRAFGRLVARFVAFYYFLLGRRARAGARSFLRRVLGREPRAAEVYRQILRFAQTTLDAFFLVAGKTHHFEVRAEGHHHLEALRQKKQGAILLGAHLGSFYAMRAQSAVEKLPLYAVVYTKNARRINEALERIDPGGNATLIEMGQGVDFALRIRELVEGGALVAILADRVAPGPGERTASVQMLGGRALLPTGPYLLAALLGCPVYLTFGLYRDPRGYDLHCEPFAERIELPRKSREAALAAYAQRYASRLEHYARLAPDNWFNFYDFWET